MINQDLLVRIVTEATSEVFSMMLDMNVDFKGVVSDGATTDGGIVSLVGMTGEWNGSGVFCCTPLFAGLISTRMLGGDFGDCAEGVNEEVLDVVAEVTNMMIGNIKNALEPVLGSMAISVPTVVHGRNFQFRSGSGVKDQVLGFSAEGEHFEIRIALAPATKARQAPALPRVPVLGFASV